MQIGIVGAGDISEEYIKIIKGFNPKNFLLTYKLINKILSKIIFYFISFKVKWQVTLYVILLIELSIKFIN